MLSENISLKTVIESWLHLRKCIHCWF